MMFWTNTAPSGPTIESAWMNGANRSVLVSTRLVFPSSISIDYYMYDRVYWCDYKQNVIESMNPDGSDRILITASGNLIPSCSSFPLKIYCYIILFAPL